MSRKDRTKKILCYLINKLNDKTEGKKKIMKLMFIMEHYDFDKNKLTSGKIGNTFHIYHYGVFSLEIMHCVNELIQENKIKDGFPLECEEEIELDKKIEDRIDKVIDKFGDSQGYDLEVETLKMLGIEPHQKREFFGKEVEELIKK